MATHSSALNSSGLSDLVLAESSASGMDIMSWIHSALRGIAGPCIHWPVAAITKAAEPSEPTIL